MIADGILLIQTKETLDQTRFSDQRIERGQKEQQCVVR